MIKPCNKGRISYGNFKHHKNFVTSDKEQAEMFVNVIEESYKNRLVRTSIVVKFIKGQNELQKLMRFRKMNVEPRLSTFAKLLSGFSSPKNLDFERFLKKYYSFYIFPYTKVFDNLGQNDNQYHKEEAVSCQ